MKKEVLKVDVKRRETHTMISQGEVKIRVESKNVREVGCKLARIQWRPFFEKPKKHKRYLCWAHVHGSLCYVEHVCLYDKERDRWLLNKKEVDVHCWLDLDFLPEVPDFDKRIIEHNQKTV